MAGFQLFNSILKATDFSQRPYNQVSAENGQKKTGQHQRQEKMENVYNLIILRGCDKETDDGKRQDENGNAGSQRCQGSALFCQQKLDFTDDDRVIDWIVIGFVDFVHGYWGLFCLQLWRFIGLESFGTASAGAKGNVEIVKKFKKYIPIVAFYQFSPRSSKWA